jgi:hypothetical protein
LIEIWTLSAAAAPAPDMSAVKMMTANHFKRNIAPSGSLRISQLPHPIYRSIEKNRCRFLYPPRASFHLGKGRWGVGLKMSTSMDLDLTEPAPLVSRAGDGTAEAEMMVLIG